MADTAYRGGLPGSIGAAAASVYPFTCPRCGESQVFHFDLVTQLREVRGMRSDGVLLIATPIADEYPQEESAEALWCRACCYRWPLPEAVEWEF